MSRELTVGDVLGGAWRVERLLGGGGMGSVYACRNLASGALAAVKVMHAHVARDATLRARFIAEGLALGRVRHAGVVRAFGEGAFGNAPFLLMELAEGRTLRQLASAHGGVLPLAELGPIVDGLLDALLAVHRAGVVHRDVKPDNVLFDGDGTALITDFGIASAGFHKGLTGTGRAMGTPHYMSPEQAMGKPVDGRSDVYACGVMLYEMLAGVPPFDGEDSYAVGYKHVHEMPTPLDVTAPAVSSALSQITMRCLAKEPGERYQRGTDLADALVRVLDAASLDTPGVRAARLGLLTPALSR